MAVRPRPSCKMTVLGSANEPMARSRPGGSELSRSTVGGDCQFGREHAMLVNTVQGHATQSFDSDATQKFTEPGTALTLNTQFMSGTSTYSGRVSNSVTSRPGSSSWFTDANARAGAEQAGRAPGGHSTSAEASLSGGIKHGFHAPVADGPSRTGTPCVTYPGGRQAAPRSYNDARTLISLSLRGVTTDCSVHGQARATGDWPAWRTGSSAARRRRRSPPMVTVIGGVQA